MHIRDSWLVEDVHAFDEASDWSAVPEVKPPAWPESDLGNLGFRALIEDHHAARRLLRASSAWPEERSRSRPRKPRSAKGVPRALSRKAARFGVQRGMSRAA